MGLLKRRRTSVTGPAWAPAFSADEATAFLAQVERAARARGLQQDIDVREGSAQFTHGDIEGQLSFGSLAAGCAEAPPASWPEIVDAHFDMVMERLGPPRELAYEEARELLKVRLWDSDVVPDAGLYRDVAAGLRAVVCLDLPETIEAITADDVARWGVPRDELFEIALENVRAQVDVDISDHDLGDGIVVRVAEGESFFSATLALRPADLGVQIGEHGALVAVPRRHTALVYPIRDAQVHLASRKLLILTGQLYDGAPGALRRDIYWWNEGELMTQRAIEDDAGMLALGVDAKFRQLLNRLAP